MNSRSISKSSTNVYNKRIPKNPKFDHVRAVVDTGASLSRHLKRIKEIKSNFHYRKDEIFKRIKLSTLVKLVIESYFMAHMNVSSYQESETTLNDEQAKKSKDNPIASTKSGLLSIVQGLGELDIEAGDKTNFHIDEFNDEKMPFLLLDVRDSEAYTQCHIKTAKSYPAPFLTRSINYETQEMLEYKNKPDKVIIIYDENETISNAVSTTLVQRGYDNVFMLSGGLKLAASKFKQGLVYGKILSSVVTNSCDASKKRNNHSRRSSYITLSDNQEFSPEDLEFLQEKLNDLSCQASCSSSIKSNRPFSSRTMSALSQYSTLSTQSKQPWR